MKVKPIDEIKSFLQKYADEAGVELVDVEFKQGKNPSLTVFIETESGVDLNTLESFHNLIDAPLDELDPTYSLAYTLNVSSPGVDRPFKTERDFERNVGKLVEVKLFAPIKNVKFFEGKLIAFDKNTITLEIEKESLKIERNQIAKINQAIVFN